MVDESLIFKIRQLRARGKTYDETASLLHVGKSTISKALKLESSPVLARAASPASPTSSFVGGEPLYMEKSTIDGDGALAKTRRSTVDGDTRDTTLINKKATELIVCSDGFLYLAPRDDPGHSLKLSHKNILSPLGKFVLFLVGIMLFIWFLKKVKREEESTS
jgi:transcriptional regulator with XRE-family HTH domain